MHRPGIAPLSFPSRATRFGFRLAGRLAGLIAAGLLGAESLAQDAPAPPARDEFSSLVKLAPVVVNGKSLAISIYARSRWDRRYGETFSEDVIKVVYEAVTESTGKGLVIIGARDEPHPLFVFRKFLALARDGKLDPEIAARGAELSKLLDRWEANANGRGSDHRDQLGEGPNLDFEKIVSALPMPLEGIGAKLYQLAWEEKFDDAKVEARLCALHPADLERRDRFKSYDWVFFLPPKGAFDRALNDAIADALKQEKMGFVARTAIKGVLLVVKPKIRRAIEGMRQGMMFMTVVRAQTPYRKDDAWTLMEAYTQVFIPFESKRKQPLEGDTDHERLVNAIRARLKKISEKSPATETASAEPAKLEAEN